MAAEKVKVLNLQRDYKVYLYFLDKEGNVCSRTKGSAGVVKVLAPNAVKREPGFLYYVDKDGDVSRSPMSRKKTAA
jgi:hypothetical protein